MRKKIPTNSNQRNFLETLCQSKGVTFCIDYNSASCPHTCNYALTKDNLDNPKFNLLDYYKENFLRK